MRSQRQRRTEPFRRLSSPCRRRSPISAGPVNGPTHQLTIGNCQVVVQLDNEAARINPSLAPPALMESLLRAVGSPPDNARSIAEAIGDWVGSAQTPKTADILKAKYQAAGLDYAPPGGPLESIERAQPGSGHDAGAFCGVAAPSDFVWPGATGSDRRRSGRRRCDRPDRRKSVNRQRQVALPHRIRCSLELIADAKGLGNARVTRVAVVRVSPSLPQGYAVLAWGNTVD